MQKRSLPANPNLEQYKKIAKLLVKAWKSNNAIDIPWEGSVVAISREHMREKHPRLRGLSEMEAETAKINLADAQFLIAREYGFESWSKFANFIKDGAGHAEGISPDLADEYRYLDMGEPIAVSLAEAIRKGEIEELKKLLEEEPSLAKVRLKDAGGKGRSLLHIATDWPGHFPDVAQTIGILIKAGAEIDAPFIGGPHRETPLHWAASSNDLEALNALLDAGADIEAKGAVIAGGTPLSDAVAFAQWAAAYRLAEIGAETNLDHESALGLMERINERFISDSPPISGEIDQAFWFACHGGQRDVAECLLKEGANPNWLPPWEKTSPLGAAIRNGFSGIAEWLRGLGSK